MAATPDGGGYWLVAADGGVFSFGNARFHGAATDSGDTFVGIAIDQHGGYWLAATNGVIHHFS
jgi:hypothetical protein